MEYPIYIYSFFFYSLCADHTWHIIYDEIKKNWEWGKDMFVISRLYVSYPCFVYMCGRGKGEGSPPTTNEMSNLLSLHRKIFKQIPIGPLSLLLANTITPPPPPLENLSSSAHVLRVWNFSFKMRSEILSFFYWGEQFSKHVCVRKSIKTEKYAQLNHPYLFEFLICLRWAKILHFFFRLLRSIHGIMNKHSCGMTHF